MAAPTINELEKQVSQLAKAGYRHWRTPAIDLGILSRAELIASALAALTDDESDPEVDSVWEAVDAGVTAAIDRLPNPFSKAAAEHFGLTVPEGQRWTLGARRKKAAKCLDRGLSWYRGRKSSAYGGVTPETYVLRLVTQALSGEADPVGWLKARASGGEESSEENRLHITSPRSGQLATAMLQATHDELLQWEFRPAPQRTGEALDRYQRTHSMRIALDGPTFLHPDHYFDFYLTLDPTRDDGGEARFVEYVRRHIAVTCAVRNPHVRIVVRAPLPNPGPGDYWGRLLWFLGPRTPSEHDAFFAACLARLDELWGPKADRGPDLLCGTDTTYPATVITQGASLLPFADSWALNQEHSPPVPHINDLVRAESEGLSAAELRRREHTDTPHRVGSLFASFDQIFDAEYVGQAEACTRLKGYLAQLRHAVRQWAAGEEY